MAKKVSAPREPKVECRAYDLQDKVGFSRGECGGELDCAKYVDCEGDDKDPGRYNGIVGMSSNTCCATGRGPPLTTPVCGSSPVMTPCTRGSCSIPSDQPSGPGVAGVFAAVPRPSQMQRMSLPGMICASRPVSIWRISMKRESKRRIYGGCQATCSAVPSHSIVCIDRLGSPCRSTYKPNSVIHGQEAHKDTGTQRCIPS